MSIVLSTPDVDGLDHVVEALRGWQVDGGPLHLHPGDLGWYSMRGAAATVAAIRVWSIDGTPRALGLLDGADLLRLAVAPAMREDDRLAARIATDVGDPERGVLPAGAATVEARGARRLAHLLTERGWQPDEPWTPFHLDLATPPRPADVRVETVGADRAAAWLAVHRSAFRGTPSTEEDRRRSAERWRTMVAGPLYVGARSLAAFDPHGDVAAVATVWSAGPGRPGLLEPMGVHRDHRGRGYGRAITLAAATALRGLGSSSAIVCAESSNVGALATYTAAGFTAGEPVADLRRPG